MIHVFTDHGRKKTEAILSVLNLVQTRLEGICTIPMSVIVLKSQQHVQ